MVDVIVDNKKNNINKFINNEQRNNERYTFLKYLHNKYKIISVVPSSKKILAK